MISPFTLIVTVKFLEVSWKFPGSFPPTTPLILLTHTLDVTHKQALNLIGHHSNHDRNHHDRLTR